MWETSQPEGKLSIRTLKSIPSCRYLRFMSSLITRAALAFILSLISAGSAFAGPSTKSRFDGAKALMLLKDLTEFGQRYPGAPKRDKAIEKQAAFLRRTGATVELQKFHTTSPIDGKSYPFANIIGRFHPQRPKRVLLGTHFDTRQVADLDAIAERRETPIAGANDGTSGVAVLIELAKYLPEILKDKRFGVDIVLFDAEDLGTRKDLSGFSRGAKYYAQQLSKPEVRGYLAGIIVDMVGEKGLILKRESYSLQRAQALTDRIWKIGRQRSESTFVMQRGGGVIDDHLPLLERGIPTTLLIDLDYPEWHTTLDTPDTCSAESLDIVGETLEVYLRTLKI